MDIITETMTSQPINMTVSSGRGMVTGAMDGGMDATMKMMTKMTMTIAHPLAVLPILHLEVRQIYHL